MAQVSPECAIAYAMIGGWRSSNDIITAVAVAMQESGLNTDAANSCCVGLWQINLKAHNTTADKMKNPVANAQMAFNIWKQAGGWCTSGNAASHSCNPWQAYGANQPGRSWQKALTDSRNAYASLIAKGIGNDILAGKGSSDPTKILADKGVNCIGMDVLGGSDINLPNPLDAVGTIASMFNRMGSWITNPDNLMRIAKVGLGFAIILVAGAALMDKEIASITPVGKIAKVIK